MLLTVFAWIFFRAEDVSHAFSYIGGIFSITIFSEPEFMERGDAFILLYLVLGFFIIEWLGRDGKHTLELNSIRWTPIRRMSLYFLIINMILILGYWGEEGFIYFQF